MVSGCVREGVSETDGISTPREEDPPLPKWTGITQSAEGPKRTKRWRKGEFSLFELGHPSPPVLGYQSPQLSGLQTGTE